MSNDASNDFVFDSNAVVIAIVSFVLGVLAGGILMYLLIKKRDAKVVDPKKTTAYDANPLKRVVVVDAQTTSINSEKTDDEPSKKSARVSFLESVKSSTRPTTSPATTPLTPSADTTPTQTTVIQKDPPMAPSPAVKKNESMRSSENVSNSVEIVCEPIKSTAKPKSEVAPKVEKVETKEKKDETKEVKKPIIVDTKAGRTPPIKGSDETSSIPSPTGSPTPIEKKSATKLSSETAVTIPQTTPPIVATPSVKKV